MMYDPDKWVVFKIVEDGEEPLYKIFATWYGGYLHGDSWKLNSGVTEIETDGDFFLFKGYSGSTYRCHTDSYGMSGYSSGVAHSLIDDVKDMPNVTVKILEQDSPEYNAFFEKFAK